MTNPTLTCRVRLLETQIDRTAGRIVPAGSIGEVLRFIPDPNVRGEKLVAVIGFHAYLVGEDLDADYHEFNVPLSEIEVYDPPSPIV